jgi:hypothetical protein
MAERVPSETVTKLESAERLLLVAIRMFFKRRDMIAVHTLAAAAYDVLRMIGRREPRVKSVYDLVEERVQPEYRKEFLNALRKPQNFFKHAAAENPDERLDFYYGNTEFILFDATLLYSAVMRGHKPETLVFMGWFIAKHPNIMKTDDPINNAVVEYAKKINLNGFESILVAIEQMKLDGIPPKVNTRST